jgi:hypothetical protein
MTAPGERMWGCVSQCAGRIGSLVTILGATGCLATNTYATPDVIPAGRWEVSAAAEGGLVTRTLGPDPRGGVGRGQDFPHRVVTQEQLVVVPTLVVARLGLSERVDVAVGGPLLPRLDAKIQLAKGPVPVAIDPTARFLVFDGSGWQVDLPLLVGVRLGERVMLLASPGVSYASAAVSQDERERGAWARLGGGIRVHVGRAFVQPEVTGMAEWAGANGKWVSAGLAVGLAAPERAP